jgi:hypothetical protein
MSFTLASFARRWCATGPVSLSLVIAMIAYGFIRRSSVLLVHKALLLRMNHMVWARVLQLTRFVWTTFLSLAFHWHPCLDALS